MAGSVNKVILIGNVGRDPEIRFTQEGLKIANFSLATSYFYKDKVTDLNREKTEWHRIVVMNEKLTEIVEKYVKKGAKLYLEGQLQTRKWTDRYITEILLSSFKGELALLSNKSSDFQGEEGNVFDLPSPPFDKNIEEDNISLNDVIPF